MRQDNVRLTEVDSRRLLALINSALLWDRRDTSNVAKLERHLEQAEVLPPESIGPDVVTMNSEVQVRDLDTRERFTFRVVFPRAANAGSGLISVLAPLGMAVLGRRKGEEITWSVPGGTRRLRIERILSQPSATAGTSASPGPARDATPRDHA